MDLNSALRNGDLLFVQDAPHLLSQAIAISTQDRNDIAPSNYTHVAVLEKQADNQFFVLHASNKYGCVHQSLKTFLQGQDSAVDAYRIKDEFHVNFEKIIQRAKNLLGNPYNFSFGSDQPGYYCSAFVYEAFKENCLFHLTPMKFGPDGGVIPFWIQYYSALNLPIPNGEPGSSPNLLLHQGVLQFIQRVK